MFQDTLRRAVAEFVGTFTLIFIGVGSIVAAHQLKDPTLIGVAIAHGLAIGVMASAVGHISGGHFNPAVTLGFLVTRRLAPSLALVYWSVQLLGATAGALLLRWFYSDSVRAMSNLGSPALGSGISVWQGVV